MHVIPRFLRHDRRASSDGQLLVQDEVALLPPHSSPCGRCCSGAGARAASCGGAATGSSASRSRTCRRHVDARLWLLDASAACGERAQRDCGWAAHASHGIIVFVGVRDPNL